MVMLTGRRDGTTHKAVDLLRSLPVELRLIGGLAVMCRVGTPHRATVDLDAVARDLPLVHEAIARIAVTAPGGGQYTFADDFDLDVIDVAPSSTRELIDLLLGHDEPLGDLDLNMIAHTWAHDTATPLDVVAVEDGTGEVLARADGRLVASPVGLVAMKATTVPLRASSRPEKRASDLYDLGRLIVVGHLGDDDCRRHARRAARRGRRAPSPLVRRPGWARPNLPRGRRFDEPRLDLDEVADAVESLTP